MNNPEKQDPSAEQTDDLQAALQALQDEYRETIAEKIASVEAAAERALAEPDPDPFDHLKTVVHKIAGSAGSYGYPEATQLCRNLEAQIQEGMEQSSLDDASWADTLDEFIRSLKQAFCPSG